MEHYKKKETVEIPLEYEFSDLSENALFFEFTPTTKVNKTIAPARTNLMNGNEVVCIGSGPEADKAVTFAEILQSRLWKMIHQQSFIMFKKIEEIWCPLIEGLDDLKVTREIPTIVILLTKKNIDKKRYGKSKTKQDDSSEKATECKQEGLKDEGR